MQTKLSIVIPFFNEQLKLKQSVEELFRYLKNEQDLEIVYVDDGSTDGTTDALQTAVHDHDSFKDLNNISFTFHRYEDNRGKGGAIIEGVKLAKGKNILFCDFDFAVSLDNISRFLEEMNALPNQRGAVIASRREDSTAFQKRSFLRKIMGEVFHLVMRMIVRIPVKDTQCGFKMFDTETAKLAFGKLKTRGFTFDVEVLLHILNQKLPIKEKSVVIDKNDPHSTINVYLDPFKMIYELLLIRLRQFKS